MLSGFSSRRRFGVGVGEEDVGDDGVRRKLSDGCGFQRNSNPSTEHHSPASLREDTGEERSCRQAEEADVESLHAFLSIPFRRFFCSGTVPSQPSPVSTLLGTHRTPLPRPPRILHRRRADPAVHQRVQVSAEVPQANVRVGH